MLRSAASNLLSDEKNVNQINQKGFTPLMIACRDKNVEACRNLLAAGADVNLSKAPVTFPLMLAVQTGKSGILELFLQERSVNVNQANDRGWTALMTVSKSNDVDACRRLLAAGADVNLSKAPRTFPLMLAVELGNLDILDLLLQERSVNVDQANDWGWTALMVACRRNNVEACRRLLTAGADVNLSKAPATFPLMLAVDFGNLTILKLFLQERSVNVNQANDAGWTALMAACRRNRRNKVEVCRNLLAAGADVNLSKAPATFPLMLAVVSRNFAILELFLEEHRSGKISLNFYQTNDSGETVLEIAEKRSELLMQKKLNQAMQENEERKISVNFICENVSPSHSPAYEDISPLSEGPGPLQPVFTGQPEAIEDLQLPASYDDRRSTLREDRSESHVSVSPGVSVTSQAIPQKSGKRNFRESSQKAQSKRPKKTMAWDPKSFSVLSANCQIFEEGWIVKHRTEGFSQVMSVMLPTTDDDDALKRYVPTILKEFQDTVPSSVALRIFIFMNRETSPKNEAKYRQKFQYYQQTLPEQLADYRSISLYLIAGGWTVDSETEITAKHRVPLGKIRNILLARVLEDGQALSRTSQSPVAILSTDDDTFFPKKFWEKVTRETKDATLESGSFGYRYDERVYQSLGFYDKKKEEQENLCELLTLANTMNMAVREEIQESYLSECSILLAGGILNGLIEYYKTNQMMLSASKEVKLFRTFNLEARGLQATALLGNYVLKNHPVSPQERPILLRYPNKEYPSKFRLSSLTQEAYSSLKIMTFMHQWCSYHHTKPNPLMWAVARSFYLPAFPHAIKRGQSCRILMELIDYRKQMWEKKFGRTDIQPQIGDWYDKDYDQIFDLTEHKDAEMPQDFLASCAQWASVIVQVLEDPILHGYRFFCQNNNQHKPYTESSKNPSFSGIDQFLTITEPPLELPHSQAVVSLSPRTVSPTHLPLRRNLPNAREEAALELEPRPFPVIRKRPLEEEGEPKDQLEKRKKQEEEKSIVWRGREESRRGSKDVREKERTPHLWSQDSTPSSSKQSFDLFTDRWTKVAEEYKKFKANKAHDLYNSVYQIVLHHNGRFSEKRIVQAMCYGMQDLAQAWDNKGNFEKTEPLVACLVRWRLHGDKQDYFDGVSQYFNCQKFFSRCLKGHRHYLGKPSLHLHELGLAYWVWDSSQGAIQSDDFLAYVASQRPGGDEKAEALTAGRDNVQFAYLALECLVEMSQKTPEKKLSAVLRNLDSVLKGYRRDEQKDYGLFLIVYDCLKQGVLRGSQDQKKTIAEILQRHEEILRREMSESRWEFLWAKSRPTHLPGSISGLDRMASQSLEKGSMLSVKKSDSIPQIQ